MAIHCTSNTRLLQSPPLIVVRLYNTISVVIMWLLQRRQEGLRFEFFYFVYGDNSCGVKGTCGIATHNLVLINGRKDN